MRQPLSRSKPPPDPQLDDPDLWALLQRATGPQLRGEMHHALRMGLNFASQDPLALTGHPALRAAALGQSDADAPLAPVESRLAAFVQLPSALAFASLDQAIRRTLQTLLAPGDAVIVDCAAHPAVAEAVLASQAQLHRSPAGSVAGVERRLARLARQPRRGRLFVAVPALSAQASRIADLAELSNLTRSFQAQLIVDATQDLGTLGPDGGGVAEIQGCAGRADILLAGLGTGFATSAALAAFRDPDLRARLAPHAETLSPVQARVLSAALDLISGADGRRRRRNLHGLALRLRNHLMADGIKVMGQPSPYVPILLPAETALPRSALLESAGPRVPLVQAPEVPLHAPRWRIQLSAAHSPADIDDLAELIRDVARAFARRSARTRVPA